MVCFTLVSMGHWREGISEECLNHRKEPLKLSGSLAWELFLGCLDVELLSSEFWNSKAPF